jgi:hypothetical protein
VLPAGGWRVGAIAAVVTAIALGACGGASPSLSTVDPLHDLITIDQLVAPDFTVTRAPAHVGAVTLAAGDSSVATVLSKDGLQSAARVEYQRGVDFGVSNGPIDVVATVERFADVGGASSAYGVSVRQVDAIHGAVPTSTGPLGDEAHAVSVVRTTSSGIAAVEITVVWRVGNLVNIVVARGRYGGTRLDDALVLAGLQTQNESGSGAA